MSDKAVLKRAMVIVLLVVLGAASIRSAAVASSSDSDPRLAQALWPSHPLPTRVRALAAIGSAAARGLPAPPQALAEMKSLARRDPLADDPFAVAGTAALVEGNNLLASQLLREAIERNPRALAPRYMLADLALRTGDTKGGLEQVLALTQQLGPTAKPIAPSLAAFAKQPDGVRLLRPILEQSQNLRQAVLSTLADDPGAVSTLLALAGPLRSNLSQDPEPWQERLLAAFLTRGDYQGAFEVWQRLTGHRSRQVGLYNPAFRRDKAPPPFNWRLASGSSGSAEALPHGGLQLMYYGRQDAVLASQTILLRPGQFSLAWQSRGSTDGLSVTITCLPGAKPIANAPLSIGQLEFAVLSDCRAQNLEIRGGLQEVAATVQPVLSGFKLTTSGRT